MCTPVAPPRTPARRRPRPDRRRPAPSVELVVPAEEDELVGLDERRSRAARRPGGRRAPRCAPRARPPCGRRRAPSRASRRSTATSSTTSTFLRERSGSSSRLRAAARRRGGASRSGPGRSPRRARRRARRPRTRRPSRSRRRRRAGTVSAIGAARRARDLAERGPANLAHRLLRRAPELHGRGEPVHGEAVGDAHPERLLPRRAALGQAGLAGLGLGRASGRGAAARLRRLRRSAASRWLPPAARRGAAVFRFFEVGMAVLRERGPCVRPDGERNLPRPRSPARLAARPAGARCRGAASSSTT